MKCKIPEISWHNRDPVLSVDIQPKHGTSAGAGFYRLASGGTDSHVLIWLMSFAENNSELLLDVAADLTRHQRAVNVVKWSPNGELLASGDDESVIFIWKQKAESEPINIVESISEQDKEIWITLKVLRGHMEDVYDLSWCPNSLYLVSGSVDNSAIIWDVHKGKSMSILNDHKGFVQGVAWDPRNQFIATLSTDRYLRIFDIQTKRVLHRVNKASLPVPEGNELYGKRMRLYHDDTLQTFFRRLCFTPDGKMLITPAGVTDYEGVAHPLHTSYVFSRYAFKQPAIVLPCPDQYTVAIKCCPLLFKLRPYNNESNPPVVPLPYRMIFAIATRSSVYLYDTQQKQPFGLISNIHYTRLTDITWSSDGCIIVVSSTDGFCSIITFESGELGEVYEESEAILTKLADENPFKDKKPRKQKDKENDAQLQKGSNTVVSAKRDTLLNDEKARDEQIITASPITLKKNEEIAPLTIAQDSSNTIKEITIKQRTPDKNEVSTTTEIQIIKEQECRVSVSTKIQLGEIIASEIILDKEILSSDEKFESPEKKCRPATPISVRRHPRTPSNTIGASLTDTTPTVVVNTKIKQTSDNSPLSSFKQMELSTAQQVKRATPIAIRRTPRALITAPSTIDKNSLVDEAMDAWPLTEENVQEQISLQNIKKSFDETQKVADKAAVVPYGIENTTDRTEDIRLVYEDTTEDAIQIEKNIENNRSIESKEEIETDCDPSSSKQLQINCPIFETKKKNEEEIPSCKTAPNTPKPSQSNSATKTPRRVALKTISTPKSKKKLLENLQEQSNLQNVKKSFDETQKVADKAAVVPYAIENTTDRTEDIRLVNEDTPEDAIQIKKNIENNQSIESKEEIETDCDPSSSKQLQINCPIFETKKENEEEIPLCKTAPNTPKQSQSNSATKTPRRVALKTLSTPKSKKKLLD